MKVRLPKVFRSKKGVALEMAVFTMITFVALSVLFTFIMMSIAQNDMRATMDFQKNIDVNNIAEDYIDALEKDKPFHQDRYHDYRILIEDCENNRQEISVFDKDTAEQRLFLVLEKEEKHVTIHRWSIIE